METCWADINLRITSKADLDGEAVGVRVNVGTNVGASVGFAEGTKVGAIVGEHEMEGIFSTVLNV